MKTLQIIRNQNSEHNPLLRNKNLTHPQSHRAENHNSQMQLKSHLFSMNHTHPPPLSSSSLLLSTHEMRRRNQTPHLLLFLLLSLFISLSVYSVSAIDVNSKALPSSDALSLLDFKSKADSTNTLPFPSPKNPLEHCKWVGVKCAQGKVVRIVLEGFNLKGVFGPNTLNRLDQLRVLSLRNNSLTGSIPDLSGLINLKTLFLHYNSFSGSFPPSIISLHRMRTLDLSHNNLSGLIPTRLIDLDWIFYLRLEWNQFNGSIPPLNQSSLQIFNVSRNNLTGAVPITVTLSRFDSSSFSWNPGLCGEILHKDCKFQSPFFVPSSQPPKPSDGFGDKQFQGLLLPPPSPKMHKSSVLILGFSVGVFLLLGSLLSVWVAIKRRRNQKRQNPPSSPLPPPPAAVDSSSVTTATNSVIPVQEESELEAKVKKIQVVKSGNLIFCSGESQICTLEQLMRGSAEMLGRGTIGTTYKAVLDNHLIVSVKRLDVSKTANMSKEVFESHIESVGRLRHPNLVPLRAYFQAKDERLLIYDYQSNGSLFSLIHGSRSTRAKPLHWTSCLKIAEDVAQGLAFIHQTSRLVHGNIKSSNVLLGADFEACLTDYCLSILASSNVDDTDSSGYKAPEIRKSSRQATPKSDVYSFGILLVELLTSKPPSQHPFLMPLDLKNWVRSVREVEDGEDSWLVMLVEVAISCSQTSPEQRPSMWQVLKMIQEIKETMMMEVNKLYTSSGFS